ncbi:putative Alpha-1,2-mannosyltransferase [Taphrina deformans PYCC 5710]|uniref:Alpha-1,2-mannosyltransferase n=1 Tax=Taphrina deformans (strain PYCC 5710 / ATCC 11124 / CBS 356.35 / IMI 108563 / JCM 9778 / NBRC 8474) TaxID=1097556 RepID=R4XHK9_TAPDE|nr:putative Alpha-1,2-mannosyltransferase [Taphrina deformans PYCC 5710]|eukprot:CCG82902.1 putative Alpha-1,2-mannosyltransferase [Taphrina deformans PYCC 5710]
MASGVRLFIRVLLGYIAVYAFVLYTWKKPLLPLNEEYLKQYKLIEAPVWDLEEALYINNAHCDPADVNFDRNAVNAHKEDWSRITMDQILLFRQSMEKYVNAAVHKGRISGRGIVMSAGDEAAMQRAIVNISLLRHYGCKLKVQIYHYEDEAEKISQNVIDRLGLLEADVIELGGLKRGTDWKAYQIKAIAIQRCSFEEILYLDTDSYLAKDPTYLFDSAPYHEHGAMLWPDFTKSHPTNPVWRLLGIPCRPEFEGESGQMLFNRARHQDTLHLAEYFALEHQTYYSFMGGDRDSFRIAALALGKRWGGPKRMVAAAGISRPNGGHTMMQSDHLGAWLFVHANLLKHSSLPKDQEKTWSRLTRHKNDTFAGTSLYGDLAGNEKLGDGVKVEVSSTPAMFTGHTTFQEDSKTSAVENVLKDKLVEEIFPDADQALRSFEDLFFRFGGVRL